MSYSGSKLDSRSWDLDAQYTPTLRSNDHNRDGSLRFSTVYQRRHTKEITLRAGALVQGSQTNTLLLVRNEAGGFSPLREFDGQLWLLEVFAQMQYKVKKRYSVNFGLHSQYLPFNGKTSIEPRAALKLKLPDDNDLIFAYGYGQPGPQF